MVGRQYKFMPLDGYQARPIVVVGMPTLPPPTGGLMLSAVESLDAGHPSLARTSLGLSTPACLALCHDVHRASGSTRKRSPKSTSSLNATTNRLREGALQLASPRG